MDDPEDPKETPEDFASNFTCAMFDSPQAVLKGARHMVCVMEFFGIKCHDTVVSCSLVVIGLWLFAGIS